jgi:signal transduction histidine kinase
VVDADISAEGRCRTHGSGIRNMSDRIAALHGTLSAGRHGDGTFVLNARIPM